MKSRSQPFWIFALFVALAVFGSINTYAEEPKNNKCKEIKTAEVEEKEFIQPNAKYMDVKKALIQHALLEAVKQTLGTEIRSNVEMQTKQVNESINDSHNELSMERAKGFVQSYDIINEETKQEGDKSALILKIKASICIPDKQNMQDIVAFGDFTINKQNDDSMRSIMMSSFPKSEKLVVSPKHAGQTVHDIKIQGQLISSSVDAIKNPEASGAKLMGGLLGAFGGAALGQAVGGMVDDKKKKANVVVTVQVIRVADQETFSETAEISEEFPVEIGEKTIIPQITKKAVEQASRAVFAKLSSRLEKEATSVASSSTPIINEQKTK